MNQNFQHNNDFNNIYVVLANINWFFNLLIFIKRKRKLLLKMNYRSMVIFYNFEGNLSKNPRSSFKFF